MKKWFKVTMSFLIAVIAWPSCCAQSKPSPDASFPHDEVVLARTTFIDIGPPFDFYNLYKLKSAATGTDVEKVAITPPGNACSQPATTEVSQAHIQQDLSELFDHKDPCSIPEKELKRDAKRCKHCLVFSGVNAATQVQCNGRTRVIRYKILDRDIFDSRTNTPAGTSRTMKLLSILDQAFGSGDLDRPIFATASSIPPKTLDETPTLREVAQGTYDGLLSAPVSQLYRDSMKPPTLPLIAITSSSPFAPIAPVLPIYPPIARAAHVGGDVMLQLQISQNGQVAEAKWVSGPLMFQAVSIEAAKKWSFPTDASGQLESVTINFNFNCPDVVTSSVFSTH